MSWRLSGQAAGLRMLSVRFARPMLPPATALSGRVLPSGSENMPFEFPVPIPGTQHFGRRRRLAEPVHRVSRRLGPPTPWRPPLRYADRSNSMSMPNDPNLSKAPVVEAVIEIKTRMAQAVGADTFAAFCSTPMRLLQTTQHIQSSTCAWTTRPGNGWCKARAMA